MDDSNDKPLFQIDKLPKVNPAYFEKIRKEMQALAEKIPVVAKAPSKKRIWCKMGDLWYGHPVTPLILRYRALIWHHANPPDPRGQKFFKRPAPYTVYVNRADMAAVLNKGLRTIDRMLAMTREALELKKYANITVEQFCSQINFPEDKMQQLLHEHYERQLKHRKSLKNEEEE